MKHLLTAILGIGLISSMATSFTNAQTNTSAPPDYSSRRSLYSTRQNELSFLVPVSMRKIRFEDTSDEVVQYVGDDALKVEINRMARGSNNTPAKVMDRLIDSWSSQVASLKVLNRTKTTLGGRSAVRIEAIALKSSRPAMYSVLYSVEGKTKAFLIRGFFKVADKETEFPRFKQMMESLKWSK